MKTMIGLVLIVISGCTFNNHQSNNSRDCKKKEFKSELVKDDTLGGPYYQSEDFAATAIDDYTIESVRKKFQDLLQLRLIPNVNTHDTTIVDTVYEFSNQRNIIAFYRTKEADFVQKFDISDSVFQLNGCISVGQLKDSLIKQFGIKEVVGDSITIGNMEHTSTYTFYFKNNKIARIGSFQYLD